MLKVWKKKWKTDEGVSDTHGRRASIGGSDFAASELERTETALPNGESSSLSSSISSNIPSKRHGEELAGKSRKRKKLANSNFADSTEGREVVRLALQENSAQIAEISGTKHSNSFSAVEILERYISSIFDRDNASKNAKYPVVILDAPASLESSLEKINPNVEVVAYSNTGSKIEKAKRKILLIDSSVSNFCNCLDYTLSLPKAFLDNLVQGSIKLKRVGSLVLGNVPSWDDDSSISHPIFRTFRNFYAVLDSSSRPLVLAGLFSFSNFLAGIAFKSLALEVALHSKIYGLTADTRAECLAKSYSVKETIVYYDSFRQPQATKLVRQLRALNSTEPTAQRLFDIHQYTLFELGPCAADLVWKRSMESLSSEFRQILQDWDFTLPNFDMNSSGFNVTPKAMKLIQILTSCQEFGDDFRGVIFVHRRMVAYMMEQLLTSLEAQLEFLRIRVVVGARNVDTSPQDNVLRSFQDGSYNLLIVTKSVEDLDIPKASVIIKFNLFDSQLSHARALSHSLQDHGHVISMVERHNSAHFNIISRISNTNPSIRGWMNAICSTSQSSAAPEIPYDSKDPYFSVSEEEELEAPSLKDPTTGSRMLPQNSLNAMHWLESTDGNSTYQPLFDFDVQADGQFVCRANLARTRLAWSAPNLTRAGARRSASYDACVELFQKGLLDSRVFPRPQMISSGSRSLPAADAKLSGTRVYEKKSPAFWSNSVIHPFARLYPQVISVESSTDSIPHHGCLLLLTRQPLPDIPMFRVFFAGLPSHVRLSRAEPFTLDERQLRAIHTYTAQLWRGILNKPYTAALEHCLVLYAPIDAGWAGKSEPNSSLPSVYSYISWDMIFALGESWIVPLKSESLEILKKDVEDAIIQDRWTQFTRRYDDVKVRSDLSPLSKPLDPELKDYENLVEVSKARRKDFHGLKDYTQPLLEVSTFPSFVDRLNPAAGPITASTSTRRYFIPELCAKVTIPASIFRTALLLPCIMRRLDDFLLVKELNVGLFSQHISEELLHVALCAPSAGIEYDYERLELLGDTFLKQISSVYVFVMYPKADEGSMHNYRQSIINNKSLLKNSVAVGLPVFIQSRPFGLRTWNPSNYPLPVDAVREDEANAASQSTNTGHTTVSSSITASDNASSSVGVTKVEKLQQRIQRKKQNLSHSTQRLGDKATDVAEAIIGAAFLSGGADVALQVVKALNIPLPGVESWSDFGRGRKIGTPSVTLEARISPSTVAAVEAIIGYHFQRPHLLIQALTHFSKTGVQLTTYERLEFIGDAILDLSMPLPYVLVVQHIFHRYKQMNPGGLTLLKGAMVSNSTLAAACVWSGLHHHLLFESALLAHDIHEYAHLLERAQAEEYSLAAKEGRPVGQYWHSIESPKALSDVVESILGAIFVSDEYSPVGAEVFFNKVLKPFYDCYISLQTLSHHPTKILFELFQSRGCQEFSIVKEHNEYLVLVHDVVLASSQDEHVISGAKVTSRIALDALEGDPGFLARTCNCWKRAK
ncbi:hypothetical protein GYMLUDRAFT_56087 [Collybiopsis luxurians FD-317 M1]|nr:hypothetical protein GYMLUDRAFT_56087 [Collybiopsis luxurians FD-317 M1]